MVSKRAFLIAALVAMAAASASAQAPGTAAPRASTPAESLRSGIELFAAGRYDEALPVFDALFLDPSAGTLRPEGAYWSAMTHIARGNAGAAEKAIDTFLTLYPTHAKAGEMLYQRGRAAFLAKDYERSIQAFQAYLAANPKGESVAAAIFWSAESLYAIGRLPEAEKLYRTVTDAYPESVKAEASRYRIALVQFKYREDELLTLLKWSHEESLRIIEEFQRREKSYEQALAVYQKRYGEAQYGTAVAQTTLEEEIAALKASMDDLAERLQGKDARVAELEAALAAAESAAAVLAAAPASGTPAAATTQPGEAEVLELQQRALALLEFYLESLAAADSTGGSR